ncbi:hypothetical protein SO802_002414 [Lithocarpus litseifolius]|uniref:Uncharacterized protein n=1 Tax=Lithocarpus litseifolius TaxID=425828 RepID=A0AAW2DX56_9ROSI
MERRLEMEMGFGDEASDFRDERADGESKMEKMEMEISEMEMEMKMKLRRWRWRWRWRWVRDERIGRERSPRGNERRERKEIINLQYFSLQFPDAKHLGAANTKYSLHLAFAFPNTNALTIYK